MKHTKSLYNELSNCIRVLTIDAVEKAQSGHPGMPLGMADVATVLYSDFLNFNPKDPKWPNRDRFILSAGHGSMLLYSILYLTGYQDIDLDDIKKFRQLGSKTAGHPEYGLLDAIEVTTGPLGQGFGNAVGVALAAKMSNTKFDKDLLNHKVYVVVGDGCLMEGISHESASLAGHLQLDNLIVLFDDNGITIDGSKDLSDSEDIEKRFESYNWEVYKIDGHDHQQIYNALSKAQKAKKPVLIACKTIIGLGSPNKEGTEKCHGAPLGIEESLLAKKSYHWNVEESFFIPENLLKIWRDIGMNSLELYENWQNRVSGLVGEQKELAEVLISRDLSALLNRAQSTILDFKKKVCKEVGKATRSSSGEFIEAVEDILPLCGGSADLSGSNCSKSKNMIGIQANKYGGNYVYYGIREHAMGAVMNGITTYGNMFVYGGTFLVFSDYMRPSIRMSALMKLPVIYIMTHDSIGVGEDGPTHQPIEHISSLRAMPNVNVLRPADAAETVECWQLALSSKNTPSVMCLTRQATKNIRPDFTVENLSAKGGYVISDSGQSPEVTILSTGSEVSLAIEVKEYLEKHKKSVRVISVPSFDLLAKQSKSYIDSIIPEFSYKVVIEAATSFGWDRLVGKEALFFCIDSFGESGPAKDLFNHFGFNVENISKTILNKVSK